MIRNRIINISTVGDVQFGEGASDTSEGVVVVKYVYFLFTVTSKQRNRNRYNQELVGSENL